MKTIRKVQNCQEAGKYTRHLLVRVRVVTRCRCILRGVLGDFTPKGCHKGRTKPVTQLHKAEKVGDICCMGVPLLGESPRHGVRKHPDDARTEIGYQLPPLSWQTEEAP